MNIIKFIVGVALGFLFASFVYMAWCFYFPSSPEIETKSERVLMV